MRVLSWNVHGCVGSDGRFDPERIARVIDRWKPDVAMLQEVGDIRGIHPPIDQATAIAEALGMDSTVGITVPRDPFGYGNVTLHRRPLSPSEIEMYDLSVRGHEPRLCLCLSVGENGSRLRAANLHLGLGRRERRLQLDILLHDAGPRLHDPDATAVVMGGDFNDWPPGPVTRTLETTFTDAARLLHQRPPKTFPSFRPMLRLDRFYVAGRVTVRSLEVDASRLARIASDHLPLIADMTL